MGITVTPITPDFAAEVGDLELSRPIAGAVLEEIKQAFWRYAVLIFPDQQLTQQQHMAFARNFGALEPGSASDRTDTENRIAPELTDVSNLVSEDGIWGAEERRRQFGRANRLWHSDASFRRVPALASLLYARRVPPLGGHTEFADQRAAYDALPADLQTRLDGLVAEHSIFHSRARIGFFDFNEEDRQRMPPVPQTVVRTVPESGRRTLYVASHAGLILGMPEQEGRALIDHLLDHATRRDFVYTHRWRPHDLVMWDNRCTLHRGTPYDDLRWQRDMQRATVSDIANSCEQEGVQVARQPMHVAENLQLQRNAKP